MNTEIVFAMRDPENIYSLAEVQSLIRKAQAQGHPIERGSYLEHMTLKQLDDLLHGKTDA